MPYKPSWKGGVIEMNPTTSRKLIVDRQNYPHASLENNIMERRGRRDESNHIKKAHH